MKIRLGKTLIETDNIETIEAVNYSGKKDAVRIRFVSGETLEVVCSTLDQATYTAVTSKSSDELLSQIISWENGSDET